MNDYPGEFSERIRGRVARYRLPGLLTAEGNFNPPGLFHTRYRCTREPFEQDGDPASWRCCHLWHRRLHNKWNSRVFAMAHDCPVPDIYWMGKRPGEIPVDELPESFVIKPVFDSTHGNNVYVVSQGRELMRGRDMSAEQVASALRKARLIHRWGRPPTPLMAIECIESAGQPAQIPLEYRIHMFAGTVGAIQLVHRFSGRKPTHDYYTPDFVYIHEVVSPGYDLSSPVEPVASLDRLLDCARRMGETLGTYVRLDFLIKGDEFVLGEMTFTPTGNGRFSDYGNRYFKAYWDQYCPDAI